MPISSFCFIEDALSLLEHAVQDRASELRHVQLATVSPGGVPEVRTLVLRAFGVSPALAELHTDMRAAKAQAISAKPQIAMLAWSAAGQVQLRFDGTAALHCGDAIARERWQRLSPNARGAYGTRVAPGRPMADPDDRTFLAPEEQYRQFGVLLISLETVDVLRLGPEGRQTRASGRLDALRSTSEWIVA